MISKEERRKAARERLKKNYDERDTGGFTGKTVIDFDKIGGYRKELIYRPKEGNNSIDIIPYIVKTKNHPQKIKKGYPDYILDLWVHRGVGPSNSQFICLQRVFGQACPICEEREEIRKNPDADENEIKQLYPKRRCWYNVVDMEKSEKEQEIQIFEESHFLFEKELLEEAANGEDGFEPFFDIEDGSTIEFRCREESSPMGKYFKYKRIDFAERDPYDEEIYEDAYSLDEIMHIPTYDEVRNTFYGVDPVDDDEEDGEEEEEKPSPKRGTKKKSFKRKKVEDEPEEEEEEPEEIEDEDPEEEEVEEEEDEDEEEEEEEDEEEEKPKKKSFKKKTTGNKTTSSKKKTTTSKKSTTSKKKSTGTKKSSTKKSSSTESADLCPFGLKWGTDNDEHENCSKCDTETWDACADERDRLDGK